MVEAAAATHVVQNVEDSSVEVISISCAGAETLWTQEVVVVKLATVLIFILE